MKNFKSVFILFISLGALISCHDTGEPVIEPLGDYENGFFVVNEGNWTTGNASLTYISDDYTIVEQEVFKNVNGVALGDTVQSVFIVDNKAYIILNGSNKIEVVNRFTMERIATIVGEGVSNPRYMIVNNGFGYISNWNNPSDATDDFIAVINLENNTVVNTIAIGEGPDRMTAKDDNIYINLKGGWNQNNKVVIVDATSNTVVNTLNVGDVPNAILKDGNNDIWVMCQGNPSYANTGETSGGLCKISNNEVVYSENFTDLKHPESLVINGNDLYYTLNAKVFTKTVEENSITHEMVAFEGNYYGMLAHAGKLYTLDAEGFSSEGTLRIFDLTSNSLEQTITTGMIPNAVVFN